MAGTLLPPGRFWKGLNEPILLVIGRIIQRCGECWANDADHRFGCVKSWRSAPRRRTAGSPTCHS